MPLHVIVTAGGMLPAELRAYSDSEVKALLRVNGARLLDCALTAARDSALANSMVVVGNDEVRRTLSPGVNFVEIGPTAVDNLHRGYLHFDDPDAEYVALSPDLPFVSGEALARFIRRCRESCEMGFPLIGAGDFLARFPGAPNRFERIDGKPVTMGSAIYFTGQLLRTNIPLFHDFFRFRRQPHKLAALLGLPIALCYLSGRLRMGMLEARASALTGGKVRAVAVPDAGLAYDVDTLENYEYALKQV